MSDVQKATLKVFGHFSFVAADGRDVGPKSAKSQALIGLLALSETGSRGRLWLQKRLWPSSPPEKAAVSLRQSLSEIRRALGEDRALLLSDRRSVALDLTRIRITEPATDAEFLEGVGLRGADKAIGEWLERQRVACATKASAPSPTVKAAPCKPVVAFNCLSETGSDLELVEEIFVDCVARSLRETLVVDVLLSGDHVIPDHALRVEIQAYRHENARVGLRARVNRGHPSALIWSGMTSTQLRGAPPVEDLEVVALGNQLIDALSDAMTTRPTEIHDIRDANMLMRLAIRRIFNKGPGGLREAEDMLVRAGKVGARALAPAWRAQLRLIQYAESGDGAKASLIPEARDLCQESLELEPMNSMVLVAVANSRLVLDGDVEGAMELARRSVATNPSNPLAWNALATAKLYSGDVKEARALALRAQRMSSGSPFGHWWDFGRCLTAALTGRVDETRDMPKSAPALSAEFRPPLRYLTALYANARASDAAGDLAPAEVSA